MTIEQLKQRFYALVAPGLPNDWDVEDAVESLVDQEQGIVDLLFLQVPVIWPISHALCFTFLSQSQVFRPVVKAGVLDTWVKELLDHYERGGLQAAQACIAQAKHFPARLSGKKGMRLEDAAGRLQPYVNGLAGRELPLESSTRTFTDTQTIYLPAELQLVNDSSQAFLLYKFIASFQWAAIRLGTHAILEQGWERENGHPLTVIFSRYSDPVLAKRLYYYFETVRILHFLEVELPGLMRQTGKLLPLLYPSVTTNNRKGSPFLQLLEELLVQLPGASLSTRWQQQLRGWVNRCWSADVDRQMSLQATADCYPAFDEESMGVFLANPLIFQGELDLEAVMAAVERRREQQRKVFIEALTSQLMQLPEQGEQRWANEEQREHAATPAPVNADQARVIVGGENESNEPDPSTAPVYVQIDNQQIKLTDELAALTRDIIDDLGCLPTHYVSSAAGQAGRSSGAPDLHPGEEGGQASAPVVYDEWDYRRKGFRKNWCVVVEKQLLPVKSTFIADTLQAYRGQIMKLRRQFEIMRTSEHFARRQRDGDDIDFDALVESLTDTAAGYPPSDRLFIKLLRDQRDIAVLFLVDMSNSTEGWVGKAIKESLVLLTEAMEILDDRYGIYGFSGMRRLRCEIFPIKGVEERLSAAVRQRIAAIHPKEYTRMAPAIRHMNALFADIEAKLKLLIMLSDGKPEDYDDYKGTYAIEDTRHALFEAKAQGVHPFCITIDRHAQSYMAHMYGPANYIFINEVERLPSLVPEIYKVLTT